MFVCNYKCIKEKDGHNTTVVQLCFKQDLVKIIVVMEIIGQRMTILSIQEVSILDQVLLLLLVANPGPIPHSLIRMNL